MMRAPFELPVRFSDDVLCANDCELVCATESASEREKEYILAAINQRDKLVTLVRALLECEELNYDDPHAPATAEVVEDATNFLKEIGE